MRHALGPICLDKYKEKKEKICQCRCQCPRPWQHNANSATTWPNRIFSAWRRPSDIRSARLARAWRFWLGATNLCNCHDSWSKASQIFGEHENRSYSLFACCSFAPQRRCGFRWPAVQSKFEFEWPLTVSNFPTLLRKRNLRLTLFYCPGILTARHILGRVHATQRDMPCL